MDVSLAQDALARDSACPSTKEAALSEQRASRRSVGRLAGTADLSDWIGSFSASRPFTLQSAAELSAALR